MDEKLDHAWRIKNYLSQFIQVADAKASAIIAACTFCVSALSILPSDLQFFEALIFTVSAFPLIQAFRFAVSCLLPRGLSRSNSKTIFFMSIAKYTEVSDYKEAFSQAQPLDEVLIQNYELSKVAKQKFEAINSAIYWLRFGLSTFCLTIFGIKILHPVVMSSITEMSKHAESRIQEPYKSTLQSKNQVKLPIADSTKANNRHGTLQNRK